MMDTKAAFEKWFNQKFELMMRNGLGITAIKRRRELYWEAWTASRAAIEIEMPNPEDYHCSGSAEAAMIDVSTAIASHGIRIKGKTE